MTTIHFEPEFYSDESYTFDDYAVEAMQYCFYPDQLLYPVLGLVSEAGEVADKIKKHYRDSDAEEIWCEDAEKEIPADTRLEIAKELGDLLFYITAIATDIGYDLDEIAHLNLDKLSDRKKRNKLTGSGDNR